ncbi:MAG: DUF434 domain-containing protein [Myxococcota bacterium]
MAQERRHRGPHPQDAELFDVERIETLRAAVADLSWLRTRGYADPSAIKLVGDRYQLRARQRTAVGRCACSDQAKARRAEARLAATAVGGRRLAIDGLNVLTTLEVALAGGVLLLGRDGCLRDMASFHGNYRLVQETDRAVEFLLQSLDDLGVAEAFVYIDRPVSNSGRLAQVIREASVRFATTVEPILSDKVDATLKSYDSVVATADSAILDASGAWMNLAHDVIAAQRGELTPLWLLDLSQ